MGYGEMVNYKNDHSQTEGTDQKKTDKEYHQMATEYYLAEESVQTEIKQLAEQFKAEDK